MRRGHLTVAARGFLITQARKVRENNGNYSFLIKDSGQLTKEDAVKFMEEQGWTTSIKAVDDGVMVTVSSSVKEDNNESAS